SGIENVYTDNNHYRKGKTKDQCEYIVGDVLQGQWGKTQAGVFDNFIGDRIRSHGNGRFRPSLKQESINVFVQVKFSLKPQQILLGRGKPAEFLIQLRDLVFQVLNNKACVLVHIS